MCLREIKARLRRGENPRQWPEAEGYTPVYVGQWVLKHEDNVYFTKHVPPHEVKDKLKALGIRRTPQTTINGWIIQPKYRVLGQTFTGEQLHQYDGLYAAGTMAHLDTHFHNLGLDRRGRVVAFDW